MNLKNSDIELLAAEEVLFLVVCSEDCLVLALLHLFVCMYQKLWKSVREIGHKPIRNGAQATLDVLGEFTIVVLLQ